MASAAAETGLSKGQRTQEAILDGAERAFAAHSFDGVSMRQIAEESGQALGVLTYHFTSKEALFEAVVLRRADEITQRRMEGLARLSNPGLEAVLEAFFEPFLERFENGEDGWKHYARVLANITHEPRWAELLAAPFGQAARSFIRAIREAEPGLTVVSANKGYVHMISVMVGLFSVNGLIDRLSSDRLSSRDVRSHYSATIAFVAGGLRALATAEASEPDATQSP